MNARFSFGVPRVTPFVRKLLITLFVCFVTELIAQNWVRFGVFETLSLPAPIWSYELAWRLWSYVLVMPPDPQSVPTLLFDLVFLWLLVAPFEERFGAKRTFQLSLLATIGAGAAGLVAGLISSRVEVLFGSQPIALASLTGFAMSFRNQRISLFGIGSLKPLHLVWITIGYSAVMFLASRNVVVFASSIGAIAIGVAFVRWITRPRRPAASKIKLIYDASQPKNPTGKWLNRQQIRYTL